ncbi:hypothetical protein L208DRAFT_1397397 [Tricholoma matsutake]|nr:hypothetical protein L208DRAFT_1397397 [Tricholoma matsutake 945]
MAIDYNCGYDLLHPVPPMVPKVKKIVRDILADVKVKCTLMIKELKNFCKDRRPLVNARCEHVCGVDIVATIQICVEQLAV